MRVRTGSDIGAACDPHHGCITCGDEAVPMRVERVDDARGLALCEDGEGRRSSVEIALVAPVALGDELLVHAGTAIARTSTGTAARGRELSGTSAGTAGRGREWSGTD